MKRFMIAIGLIVGIAQVGTSVADNAAALPTASPVITAGVPVEQEAAPDTASARGVIPCEFGDFNGDGIPFGTADVPGFVDAVLGNNPDPICGDMNADGLVDGNDIQLFVNAVLGI